MHILQSIWAIFFLSVTVCIKSAPEVLQKKNTKLLGEIPVVHIIFNDLLITTHNEAKHDVTFCSMLEHARCYDARFNHNKLLF